MFLSILELRIERKKILGENCFENGVSNLWKKVNVSTKVLLEKSLKTKNN
jgi:hypothetical protein